MDDHAKVVAARWANMRIEAIARGTPAAEFDANALHFLAGEAGWSEKDAQAIIKRMQRLSGEGGENENET